MKTCETCKYAKWQLTEKGNIRKSQVGQCTYKIIMPKLPLSAKRYFSFNPVFHKTVIRLCEIAQCDCYEPKQKSIS